MVFPHHEAHGKEHEDHACNVEPGECAAKHEQRHGKGGDGLEGADDGCRRAAYEVNGAGDQQQRHNGGKQGQPGCTAPRAGTMQGREVEPEATAYKEEHQPRERGIEGETEGGHGAQHAAVHSHDVDGIGKSRGHSHDHAQHTLAAARIAMQAADARKGENEAHEGHPREALVKTGPRDEGDKHGIGEQDDRSDAGIHELEADKQAHRRQGKQLAHGQREYQLAACGMKGLAQHGHEQAHQEHGEAVAVKQHRHGCDAHAVERKCKQGVEPVGHRPHNGHRVAGHLW